MSNELESIALSKERIELMLRQNGIYPNNSALYSSGLYHALREAYNAGLAAAVNKCEWYEDQCGSFTSAEERAKRQAAREIKRDILALISRFKALLTEIDAAEAQVTQEEE